METRPLIQNHGGSSWWMYQIGQIEVRENIYISIDVTIYGAPRIAWDTWPIFSIVNPENRYEKWAALFASSDLGFLFEYKAFDGITNWYPVGFGGQEYTNTSLQNGTSYNIELLVIGTHYRLYLDNVLYIDRNDAPNLLVIPLPLVPQNIYTYQ